MISTIHFTEMTSTLGVITLTATDHGLCGLYFAGQKHWPQNASSWQRDDGPRFDSAREWVSQYFSREQTPFAGPLHFVIGTAFQQQVWRALQTIPSGKTWTYAQLAQHIGAAKAVRAVGAAVGRNPLSLIIPCHRVIGSSGSLTGYAGGLDRKRWLLQHEGVFSAPTLLLT